MFQWMTNPTDRFVFIVDPEWLLGRMDKMDIFLGSLEVSRFPRTSVRLLVHRSDSPVLHSVYSLLKRTIY